MLLVCLPGPAFSQVISEEAEMNRLQARAEEAIANGDSDGAALHSGAICSSQASYSACLSVRTRCVMTTVAPSLPMEVGWGNWGLRGCFVLALCRLTPERSGRAGRNA